MSIYIKLSFTFLIFFLIGWCFLYPETKLAKWGEEKYGSYGGFLVRATAILLTPSVILFLSWIWLDN